MNERIKELAEQAGLEFDDDESLEFGKQIYYVTKEDMEKFAELIVERCLSMIENEAAQYAQPVWEVELLNDIRDHFGVEE